MSMRFAGSCLRDLLMFVMLVALSGSIVPAFDEAPVIRCDHHLAVVQRSGSHPKVVDATMVSRRRATSARLAPRGREERLCSSRQVGRRGRGVSGSAADSSLRSSPLHRARSKISCSAIYSGVANPRRRGMRRDSVRRAPWRSTPTTRPGQRQSANGPRCPNARR